MLGDTDLKAGDLTSSLESGSHGLDALEQTLISDNYGRTVWGLLPPCGKSNPINLSCGLIIAWYT